MRFVTILFFNLVYFILTLLTHFFYKFMIYLDPGVRTSLNVFPQIFSPNITRVGIHAVGKVF